MRGNVGERERERERREGRREGAKERKRARESQEWEKRKQEGQCGV